MPNDESVDPIIRKLRAATAELAQLATADESPIRVSSGLRPQVDDLKSLERSVAQYIASTREIPYFGFIGQFSSGKSALINSLCGYRFLYTDEHASGVEDTTAEATVLAHEHNASPILEDRPGPLSIVEMRKTSGFLEARYVVDTPGKGDPGTQSKIVEEILPLCDALVYVFTAKHPLDEADKLLLAYVRDQAVVPVVYCVTHSVTFTVDRQPPVEEQRIDRPRRGQWVGKLNGKLEEFVPGLSLEENEISFVENIDDPQVPMDGPIAEGYGVANLRSALQAMPIDTASIHSIKLEYFWNRLIGIIGTFSQHCQSLSSAISELIENTEKAHLKRQQRVLGNIDDLKTGWNRAATAFETSSADFSKLHARLESQTEGAPQILKWQDQPDLLKAVEDAVDSLTGSVAAHSYRFAKTEFDRRFERASDQARDPAVFRSDRSLTFSQANSLFDAVLLASRAHVTTWLGQLIRTARENDIQTLRKSLDAVRSTRRELETFAKEQRLLKQEASILAQQKKDVEAAIKDFLQSISDFRNSIVAAGGWELVARAGFSGELDQAVENDEKYVTENVDRIYELFAGETGSVRDELRRMVLSGEKEVASEDTVVIVDRAARHLRTTEDQAATFRLNPVVADELLREVVRPTAEKLNVALADYESQCQTALLKARESAGARHSESTTEAMAAWEIECRNIDAAYEEHNRQSNAEFERAKRAYEDARGRAKQWWIQTYMLFAVCIFAIGLGVVLAIVLPDSFAKTAVVTALITGAGTTIWARLRKLPKVPAAPLPRPVSERPSLPPPPSPRDLQDFTDESIELPSSELASIGFSEDTLRKALRGRIRERLLSTIALDNESHLATLAEPQEDIATLQRISKTALNEYAAAWRRLCDQSAFWYGGADEKAGKFLSVILKERSRSVDEIIKIFRDRVAKLEDMLDRFRQLRER